jgi:hypothetical protein
MLYPFEPWGWHGGTLRLRTAAAACEPRDLVIRWWNAAERTWSEPLEPEMIGKNPASAPDGERRDGLQRLKRTIFPSTLWESGRHAVTAARSMLQSREFATDEVVILHTTYLAPLIPVLATVGARVAIDVHDLVWRAHRIDATTAGSPLWALRGAYAGTVRAREQRLLAAADRLLVAGYRDYELLAALPPRVSWAPTGVDGRPTGGPCTPPVRIGLIGNFAHSATADAARRLADSPLATAHGDIRLVFAGIGSERWHGHGAIDVLGKVDDVDQFYGQVNVVVVPVTSGSGMKCKLAEAVLCGKAVITTASGASGYPPGLRRQFHVVADPLLLAPSEIGAIARAHDPVRGHAAFDREVGFAAAAHRYRDALA